MTRDSLARHDGDGVLDKHRPEPMLAEANAASEHVFDMRFTAERQTRLVNVQGLGTNAQALQMKNEQGDGP